MFEGTNINHSKSCSIQQVQEVFQYASNCMIRKAKQLVMDQGIKSSPHSKPGLALNEVIVEVARSFYSSEKMSRVIHVKKRRHIN
jgi:hypothetical protein